MLRSLRWKYNSEPFMVVWMQVRGKSRVSGKVKLKNKPKNRKKCVINPKYVYEVWINKVYLKMVENSLNLFLFDRSLWKKSLPTCQSASSSSVQLVKEETLVSDLITQGLLYKQVTLMGAKSCVNMRQWISRTYNKGIRHFGDRTILLLPQIYMNCIIATICRTPCAT